MAANSSQLLFPSDVLKWMKLNAKPRMSFKLMQCYKYFQYKNFPFVVTHELCSDGEKWSYKKADSVIKADIGDGSINFCLTKKLDLILKNNITFLMPKIVYCEISYLRLQKQNISITDLSFLCAAGKINRFVMSYTFITDNDGNLASMDSILECLPNVDYIYFNHHHPSIVSVEYVNKIVSLKLKEFGMWNVVIDAFSFETFFSFMEKHQTILYQMTILRAECTKVKAVQEGITKLLTNWPISLPKPYLRCHGY